MSHFRDFIMSSTLYYLPVSPPCRSVLLLARALGIKLNLKEVNVLQGEQMKPEFLAINPEHTIPTLVEGDFTLWESRPILTYLASQYGKDDSLYPHDLKKRAKIDRMLYFDMGTLSRRLIDYFVPVFFGGQKQFDAEKLNKIEEALGYLDEAMKGNNWAADDHITVADYALAATVATLDAIDVNVNEFPNVARWFANCKSSMPGYVDINETPAKNLGLAAKSKLAK